MGLVAPVDVMSNDDVTQTLTPSVLIFVHLTLQVGAPARVGLVAPVDVTVPAGNTGLDPSQTNFFQVNKAGRHQEFQILCFCEGFSCKRLAVMSWSCHSASGRHAFAAASIC